MLSTHGSLLGYRKYHQPASRQIAARLYDLLTLKTVAKRAQAVVVSSEMEYQEALEFGIRKDRLHLIPDGIEVPALSPQPEEPQGAPLHLLFAGPLTRIRRQDLLLRAARKLTVPFRITLIATNEIQNSPEDKAYLNELQKLSQVLGIQDRVGFLQNPSPEDLQRGYADADIFFYLSSYETSGETLIEAAAHGLPIIATPVGPAGAVVSTGQSGFIVPADPDMICDRILQISDPGTRRRFGRASRENVVKHCGWTSVMERYTELYRSLLI